MTRFFASRWVKRALIAGVILAAWEAAYQLRLLSPIIFGSPSLVLEAALQDGATFASAAQVTLLEILAATAFAVAAGIPLGLLMGMTSMSASIFAPMLSTILAVPIVILYPLLIAYLGIDPVSKIVFGSIGGVFPIALSTLLGVRANDQNYTTMSVAMGASRLEALFKVSLPFALPPIIAGLRIGISLVIVYVIQGEMIAAYDGIGFLISYNRTLFNTGHVYLGILIALFFAYVANVILYRAEEKYGRWRLMQQSAV
jgi:NitT/TauT family transport system permease protein